MLESPKKSWDKHGFSPAINWCPRPRCPGAIHGIKDHAQLGARRVEAVRVDDDLNSGAVDQLEENLGKPIGKWENHRKTMGKP